MASATFFGLRLCSCSSLIDKWSSPYPEHSSRLSAIHGQSAFGISCKNPATMRWPIVFFRSRFLGASSSIPKVAFSKLRHDLCSRDRLQRGDGSSAHCAHTPLRSLTPAAFSLKTVYTAKKKQHRLELSHTFRFQSISLEAYNEAD